MKLERFNEAWKWNHNAKQKIWKILFSHSLEVWYAQFATDRLVWGPASAFLRGKSKLGVMDSDFSGRKVFLKTSARFTVGACVASRVISLFKLLESLFQIQCAIRKKRRSAPERDVAAHRAGEWTLFLH